MPENEAQLPTDLAILEVGKLKQHLQQQNPDMHWVERIKFGGLLDLPDVDGNTRAQGPVSGMAIDLLNSESGEIDRLNISKSLVSGRLPQKSGEILVRSGLRSKDRY